MSSPKEEKPKRKYNKKQKATAILPNGEIYPIPCLQDFIEKYGINKFDLYKMMKGKRKKYKGVHIIWGEATPEKLQEAVAPHPPKKRPSKYTPKKRHKKKRKPGVQVGNSFEFIDHDSFYFRTRIRRHIFTHPDTGKRYQVFSRNREQSISQLKADGIIPIDTNWSSYKKRKYLKDDMCRRIIAPNLPIVIWREYDLGMLKRFGFKLGKTPE